MIDGIGLGVALGLAWWLPTVSLAAIPAVLGLMPRKDADSLRVTAVAVAVAVAVAAATRGFLPAALDRDRVLALGIAFALFLAGFRRLLEVDDLRTALAGLVAAGALGTLQLERLAPGGWFEGPVGGALSGLGAVVPGLAFRPAGATAVVVAMTVGIAALAAWIRLGESGGALWTGLAIGSAIACWPLQRLEPAALGGWLLGHHPSPGEVATVDALYWPSVPLDSARGHVVAAAVGMAIGLAIGWGGPARAPTR